MIISHKHRYLFLELPYTATKAISRDLRSYYDGERILTKHSNYAEFLRVANEDEKKYFVFSTIRNPLDEPVSLYHKYRNGDPELFERFSPDSKGIHFWLYNLVRRGQVKAARDENTTVTEFFRSFYRYPYDNWSSTTREHCDFTIRYEYLQEDFSEVLRRLNIEQVRPLPIVARSEGRKKASSEDYYEGEDRVHAMRIFGPFMKRTHYTFPESWGPYKGRFIDELRFRFYGLFRHLYWKRLRWYTQTTKDWHNNQQVELPQQHQDAVNS